MFPALFPKPTARDRGFTLPKGFTLIELLIVVAIIAVLASIAVPNFLEAQTRSKVARVQADLRTLSIGLESYRVDHNNYPEGTDDPNKYDPRFSTYLGPLAKGYYTLASRNGDNVFAGTHFHTVTTPVAYVSEFFRDPFAEGGKVLTYCYRPAKDRKNGFILTSFGPDADVFTAEDGRIGVGTRALNPLSTFMDTGNPARLGDINERAVVHSLENTQPGLNEALQLWGGLKPALGHLAYDPTNGTVSDGDIFRLGP